MSSDFVQRFLFEDFPVRGAVIRVDQTWQALLQQRDYPASVADLLGQLLAASGLLAAQIKWEGSLSLQLQSKGSLRVALAQCNQAGDMRGIARFDELTDSLPMLGPDAVLAITLEPEETSAVGPRSQRYQGIVQLQTDGLAATLTEYFNQSEQLPTRVWLKSQGSGMAGLLLQKLPESSADQDGWNRVVHLAETISAEELLALDTETLLHRLFNEETVRLFEAKDVRFRCSCSQQKVTDMLRSLGEAEARSVLDEQGEIEVGCEYCGRQYRFDAVDVEQLFNDHGFSVDGPSQAQ